MGMRVGSKKSLNKYSEKNKSNEIDDNSNELKEEVKWARGIKISWKSVVLFFVFEIMFTTATGPFVLLYGPFNNAKKAYVGAAMGSFKHQYLATTFLSKERIDKITKEDVQEDVVEDIPTVADVVQIPKKHDNTIELKSFENFKIKGYGLIIKDPTRIKVGYSSKLGIEGETTSEIAEKFDAVAAINGGAFIDKSSSEAWTGNGGVASGIIMSEGEIKHVDPWIEKGEKSELVAITRSGQLLAGEYTLQELKALEVQEAVTFKPVLVKNGKATKLSNYEGPAPRTAIGQTKDGEIVLVVIEGRDLLEGAGANLKELQEILINKFNVVTALNLDGGKSTTMYLNGEVVNKLSDSLGERSLPSAIIVK